ncbi:MAG: hypothetical protein R3B72_23625 [Polyangiaceae bacterium]
MTSLPPPRGTTKARGPLLLLVLALLAVTPRASADDAAEQFTKAVSLFDAEDYAAALPLFEGAFAVTESPNARLYVARCLVKMDRLVEGYREMAGTLALARKKAEEEPKYARTRDAAAAELAVLEPKIGKVVVALGDSEVGATIEVEGRRLTPEEVGLPVVVLPGNVEVVASAEGKEPFRTTVEVAGGGLETVAIVFRDPTPTETPEPEEDGPGLGVLRIAGIAVAGLGVASLATFAATGVLAKSKFDEVEKACGGTRCTDLAYAEDIDSGKQLQTIANATLGIGLGLVAAGTLMIVFGGPSEDDDSAPEAALSVVPLVGGGYVGVSGSF